MRKDIAAVIADAERYLHDEGYSPEPIQRHLYVWHRLEDYANSRGETQLTQALIDRFVDSACRSNGFKERSTNRYEVYAGQLLRFSETGSMRRAGGESGQDVPERFQEAFSAYLARLEARKLAESTIHRTAFYTAQFLTHVSDRAEDLSTLKAADIESYIVTLEGLAQSTRNSIKSDLLRFLDVAVSSFGADPSLKEAPCLRLAPCRPALQSFYTPEEIGRVLEASYSGRYPRRNRLVVALCVQYGLRIGDVASLKLSDFRWADGSIRIVQSKSGSPLVLPITDEIKLCVADYLKNERPETDSPYLFVRMTPPGKGEGPVESLKGVVRRTFVESGIDIRGRRTGTHSLRHSFATALMAENTPYHEISLVLGHTSPNVTKRYLGIDIENLRKLSLEVSVYAA